jgi:D-beta-D-heptose 7-phosphate kinase / D-beta-D-heptose 1-phosphate adenosyltransferase
VAVTGPDTVPVELVPPAPAALAGLVAERAPRVLVLGDAVLDTWLHGAAHRLGRDAPVPVVELIGRESVPGGAGNLAANLAALGGAVTLLTVVGADPDGTALLDDLRARGVDVDGVVRDPGRRTPVKHRLATAGHTVARFDAEPHGPLGAAAEAALCAALGRALDDGDFDAVVVADYGLGTMPRCAREVLRRPGRPRLVVDAHDPAAWADLAPDLVTPSIAEAAGALGEPVPTADRLAWGALRRAELVHRLGGPDVLLTCDVDGALLLSADDPAVRHARVAHAAPPSLACGAGDTFTAAATLARCLGVPPGAVLGLAQAAADVACAEPGTAVCDTAALTARLAHADRGAVLTHADLLAVLAEHRRRGHRIVFTNGCFDVLHRGHVAYLRQARALGDVLVVALNSDASVSRLKGPQRPVNPLADRAGVVGALDCVDLVTSFEEDSPVGLVERVRPQIYAKGGDYTPQMLPETPVVERLGGQVRILDYLSDHSTTAIVERIRTPSGEPS